MPKPEECIEIRKSFALAARPLYACGKLVEYGILPLPTSVDVGGLIVQACVFKRKSKADAEIDLGLVLHAMGVDPSDISIMECTHKNSLIPFVMLGRGEIILDAKDDEALEDPGSLLNVAFTAYEPMLKRFCEITGLDKMYFHCSGDSSPDPVPYEQGVLHIFTNASPPGEQNTEHFGDIGGLPLRTDRMHEPGQAPTLGRGQVVRVKNSANKGAAVAQIVGASNLYLLFPTIGPFNKVTSVDIMSTVLIAFNEQCRKHTSAKPPKIKSAGPKAFKSLTAKWVDHITGGVDEHIKGIDEKIAQLQANLAGLIRGKAEFVSLRDTFMSSGYVGKSLQRLPSDYRRIAGHPDVAAVQIVDGGLHIITKDIHVSHEGKTYNTGSFVIRVGSEGKLSVWNDAPKHPKGISHPHIGVSGIVCFGNATIVITQAAAEHRYADAIEYVLRWLKDGYTDNLADTKIVEWPQVEESVDTAVETFVEDGNASA